MSSNLCLGDIAEITMGQSPAGENCNISGVGLPLLNGPTEFGSKYPHPVQFTTEAKKLAKSGDLLFCVRGSTTGRMNWANQTYVIGRGLAAIRGKNGYPNSYIRAAIESNLDSLLIQATGSTFPNVSRDLISGMTIPKTSPDEAVMVASILEPIDDRIALLRDTNATLEAIAQALFKSWFVDFDPVHAKQQGRRPEGIDEATAALFPDSFEESELGLVPTGWNIVQLDDICELQRGLSYKGDGLSENQGAHMFNLGCFNAPRIFATEKIKRYTGAYKGHHAVKAGDLIVANTDMTQDRAILGRPLVIPKGYDSGFISHHVYKVKQNKSCLIDLTSYLFFSFLQPAFRDIAVGYATGTTVLALPKEALQKHKLIMAGDELIGKFTEITNSIFSTIELNIEKENCLATIRDTLLPRLISGQLRLTEAETPVEEMH